MGLCLGRDQHREPRHHHQPDTSHPSFRLEEEKHGSSSFDQNKETNNQKNTMKQNDSKTRPEITDCLQAIKEPHWPPAVALDGELAMSCILPSLLVWMKTRYKAGISNYCSKGGRRKSCAPEPKGSLTTVNVLQFLLPPPLKVPIFQELWFCLITIAAEPKIASSSFDTKNQHKKGNNGTGYERVGVRPVLAGVWSYPGLLLFDRSLLVQLINPDTSVPNKNLGGNDTNHRPPASDSVHGPILCKC